MCECGVPRGMNTFFFSQVLWQTSFRARYPSSSETRKNFHERQRVRKYKTATRDIPK